MAHSFIVRFEDPELGGDQYITANNGVTIYEIDAAAFEYEETAKKAAEMSGLVVGCPEALNNAVIKRVPWDSTIAFVQGSSSFYTWNDVTNEDLNGWRRSCERARSEWRRRGHAD